MTQWLLQGPALTQQTAQEIADSIAGRIIETPNAIRIISEQATNSEQIAQLRQDYSFDINVLPPHFNPDEVKLLMTDMDSTLIAIECIDEIADFVGVKPQVSAITESAMRGEIDFETSLNQRVALLEGLKVDVLNEVFEQRLQLNPGAETLISGLKRLGIKTALVSGGFTFFTEKLKKQLQLDYTLANHLELQDGRLTGRVAGAICGAKAKADFLQQQCEKLNINLSQTITMGDGANDLLMMEQSGLSVAYHAKPKVQREADIVINYCGLDAVLALLNYNL